MKKIILLALVLYFPLQALAAGPSNLQIDLGVQYDGWNSSWGLYPVDGWEIFTPLSVVFKADSGLSFYGQTEFGNGSYTGTVIDPMSTLTLTDFSDTILGTELHFKTFSLPSMINLAFNVPTGNSSWEEDQIGSNVPTEFLDTRYRGRGFGTNFLYGLSLASGTGAYGVAAGYMYAGAFNPNYDEQPGVTQLKLGDSVFLSLNHIQPYSNNQNEVIRLSAFYSLPSSQNGENVFQLGTNLNASYGWMNPKAFSFELGAQYYFPSGRLLGNSDQLSTEPDNSFAPRFYLTPSYVFGDFTLAGIVKYILPNGYSQGNTLYDGGGILLGLTPSIKFVLDGHSAIRFNAGYDYILWDTSGWNMGANNLAAVSETYNYWSVGTNYELKI